MARWSNFKIWRGKLPHWRAEGVRYFVTFRHRRPLEDGECHTLFVTMMKAQRRKFDFVILVVLPERTDMIFTLQPGAEDEELELSDVVEKAKRKAGAQIIKRSGERFPPFYAESFDRIIRDDGELETLWNQVLTSPETEGVCEDADNYPYTFASPEAEVSIGAPE